ncbi:MAG TPA: hypothetical protein VEU28_08895 [Actinomycetota bacterium]|nr:hypothetical protein [Actinomycetota bacterium]
MLVLVSVVCSLGIWLSNSAADPLQKSSGERRISAASGFGEAEPAPTPEPSEEPVVAPEPTRIQVVDPPQVRSRPAPAKTAAGPSQQNPHRFADSKWFDVFGCDRIPSLSHMELVAGTPVTSAYENTKAVLRCSILPINKIDEEVTLELTQSPVSGRFEPPTVRPGQGGMMVPQPPGGGAPQLFLGNLVSTTLTLDTEHLPPGRYTFEVTGRSAGTHSSRTMTLTILSNVPPPPLAPAPPPPLPNHEDLPPFPVAPTPTP